MHSYYRFLIAYEANPGIICNASNIARTSHNHFFLPNLFYTNYTYLGPSTDRLVTVEV